MRNMSTGKFLAAAYVLGLIWSVALIGGAVVLTQPTLELYIALGIDSMPVQVAATMSLVIVLATVVTVAVGLALRSVAAHLPAAHGAGAARGVASHHA